MPWSGGVYTRSNGVFTGATVWASDASVGTDITTAHHDTHDQDLATGLNNCVTIDGLNQIAASFVPDVDATYNLGAATFRWANVYVSGNVTGGTFLNSTISAPALTGTVTGTYTLGGTPTITAPTIAMPTLSGTVAGTYTLGGTPTIPTSGLSGSVSPTNGGTGTTAGTTVPATWTPTDASGATLSITNNGSYYYQVGKMVTLVLDITYPSTSDGSTALIGGVPVSADANLNNFAVTGLTYGLGSSGFSLVNGDQIEMFTIVTGTPLTNAQLSTARARGFLTYFTA